jgi:hypothetical protein
MVMALSLCHRPLHEPPVVALLEPADDALVPKVVRVRALTSTQAGIREARLYIDGELTLTQDHDCDSVLTFIWNASELPPWSRHSITVEVTDIDAYYGTSDSVSVVIAATSGPTSHEGTITRDETWYAAGSPHRVNANLTVEAELTIEPGCVVEFADGGGLVIGNGALVARGASSLITFTGRQAVPGAWQSIEFSSRARPDRSVLDNCLIEYGGGGNAWSSVVVAAPVRISNCVFRNSAQTGLAIGPMLAPYIGEGNLFSGNYPDAILIAGTDITSDTRWDDHGVPYLLGDYVYVEGSDLTATLTIGPGTTILSGSGGAIYIDYEGALIADGSSGVIVLTSQDPGDVWGGIEFEGDGSSIVQGVLKNCLIQNAANDINSALFLKGAVVEMENSVISNAQGYGVECEFGSYFASFRNNVIIGCTDKAMQMDMEFVPTIGEGNSFTGNDIDGNYHDGIILVNGVEDGIVTSATWRNLGVPYILEDDLYVEELNGTPPILTLEPGTRLEFDDAGLFVYDGALIADGTSSRITFTGYDASEPWDGIVFRSTPNAPQSLLRNCLIEYGGQSGGNIVCDSCAPVIEGNEINHSRRFGILLNNSPLNPDSLLANNRFHDNDSGDVGVAPQFTTEKAHRQPPGFRRVVGVRHAARNPVGSRAASARVEAHRHRLARLE